METTTNDAERSWRWDLLDTTDWLYSSIIWPLGPWTIWIDSGSTSLLQRHSTWRIDLLVAKASYNFGKFHSDLPTWYIIKETIYKGSDCFRRQCEVCSSPWNKPIWNDWINKSSNQNHLIQGTPSVAAKNHWWLVRLWNCPIFHSYGFKGWSDDRRLQLFKQKLVKRQTHFMMCIGLSWSAAVPL